MSEWQSIDTAPKDGTPVLLWTDHEHAIAEWNGGEWWLIACQEALFDGDRPATVPCRPTHWMPLPKPPSDNPR
jgi:hypothetical protein